MAACGNVVDRKNAARRTRAGVAVLVLILFTAVTLGSAWHHHDARSESNCSICHFGHQPAQEPVVGQQITALTVVYSALPQAEVLLFEGPPLPRFGSRAPPAV
jgi:hypothetical protein